jgi:nitroimidazol reductase NimA-like FMN-containing flavoprotein (pyridoxamine 5'-phosphate oxidase superfamily)
MTGSPRIRTLSRAEIDAILSRNHVGRLAYSVHERVDIEPIHYVYGEGVLYGRTSAGSKLTALGHRPWVAFEVDESEDLFDWRSVVVHGTVYAVEDGDLAADHHDFAQTLERIRTLVPEALLDDDPTPKRSFLFRIHIETATGRQSMQHGRVKAI